MIPAPYNSAVLITDHWLEPDDRENYLLLDYEQGGIALNDPTQGLRVQAWTLTYAPLSADMIIKDEALNATVLFNRPSITQISLAFDQNMNPFVAFTEDDAGTAEPWFWWFDTDLADTVFTPLPAGAVNPVCCLDDKRETQTFSSDIILAYVLNDNLYFRAQRDRYTVEYLYYFGLPENTICKRVGMNKKNRLQFLMETFGDEWIC